jgi:mannitol-specific phosphotransferase system IIBC component
MSLVLSLHRGLFIAGLVLTLIVAVWGFTNFARRLAPGGSFNSALVLVEALFIVQGLAGATLFVSGRRPHDTLHWLYGILLVIVVPIAATYTSGRDARRQSLVYAIAGLFMAGLAIRALTTS